MVIEQDDKVNNSVVVNGTKILNYTDATAVGFIIFLKRVLDDRTV